PNVRFSVALNSSFSPGRWPTYRSSRRYASLAPSTACPFQTTFPCVGGVRPTTVRSRLVLPLPLSPWTIRQSPAPSSKFSLLNRRRSPRLHSRSMALSMFCLALMRGESLFASLYCRFELVFQANMQNTSDGLTEH